jgi:hypothetical protein
MTAVIPLSRSLALQTFEIRPTPSTLPAGQKADELMIDWSDLPAGGTASIYLPAVSADDVLALASSMYVTHRFSRADAHTLACDAGGISYLPIPKGSGQNYAGLLSITLPAATARQPTYSVKVRQVVNVGPETRRVDSGTGNAPRTSSRRILGTFQVSLSVKTPDQALLANERLYAVFRWILEAIPPASRWYPVLVRYLDELAGIITALGGNPGQILPSPSGQVPARPQPPRPVKATQEFTGKIEGITYDHFGDFEGFILETETGRHHRFSSREASVRDLVRQVWIERTRVTVFVELDRPHIPQSIVLHA